MTQAGTNFSPKTPWITSCAVHDGFLKNKVAQKQLCLHVQGSLILFQGYISAIHHANWNCAILTQNTYLKQHIFWGLGNSQPHPI